MKKLGELIQEARQDKGMKVKELGVLTGVSSSHLSRIERGDRIPSAPILQKLAKPLGLGETELLKTAGYMSQDETDDRLAKLKADCIEEIMDIMLMLCKKVNSL